MAPGERYAVRGMQGAWQGQRLAAGPLADGGWPLDGQTQDQLFYCEVSPDDWRELFGVVEAPEGIGRLLILLGVGGQGTTEDVIWFDDVELYRLTNHLHGR